MSMRFNILWFEDNEEWYETNRENIEEYLASKNFVADFTHYDSTDKIAEIRAFDEYDLILVDLKLDHGTKERLITSSVRVFLITPVFRLSGTRIRVTPPKKEYAWICASIQ